MIGGLSDPLWALLYEPVIKKKIQEYLADSKAFVAASAELVSTKDLL